MKTYVLAAGILAGLTVPSMAQDYVVVRDPDSEDCRVVERTTTVTPRGILGGRIFRNRVEAQEQTTVLCREAAPTVVERESPPVVVERERAPVVIERERDPVVIEEDRGGDRVIIDRD